MQTTQITLPPDAHILLVKLAGIGDLLLATPAIQALRDSYPQARIDLLVTPESAGLLQGWDAINTIIVLDKYLFDDLKQVAKRPQALLPLQKLWQTLHSAHYDAVLLLHHLTLRFGRLKHQLLMRAAGAKWRVGLDNGHGWFLNVHVHDGGFGAMHETDYMLALAQAVGAQPAHKRLFIPLTDTERKQAREIVYGSAASSGKPLIALHPGSGGYSTARRWAPDRFAQLAEQLYRSEGGEILLLGGPEEAALHEQIIQMVQQISPTVPVRSLAGKGNIKVAAAILELMDLFVGNDAGLMHLAVAVNTPTVAIFGLSNYKAWGPYTDATRATVVHLDLACMPCFYRGHDLGTPEGCATRDCLTHLTVEPVAVAARTMLKTLKA